MGRSGVHDLRVSAKLLPGDRVALLVPGSRSLVDAVISLLIRGIVPILLDHKLTPSERDQLISSLEPRLTVTESDGLEELLLGWEPGDLPLTRPMHVTSGTTGTPKGVWCGLLSRPDARAHFAEEVELWGFNDNDKNLVISPLHHSAPLRFAIGTLLQGGTIMGFGAAGKQLAFDPGLITAHIREQQPTTAFCVPTHLQRLFAHWDQVGQPELSSFRLLAHAGAPCPEPVKRRLLETFPPHTTWEFYGSTEGQFTACSSEEWLEHPGTVGRARPGRSLRIDDAGQIWCAVPRHARFEYFNSPEKTAAAWSGAEFTVGDLGRLDADGYLYLDGRREDLIITGGVNVYPTEVEQVIGRLPGVVEVAVYGVSDDNWGQAVCAAVVGTVSEEQLQTWARTHLAPPKRPKQWQLRDALPRTPTGKIRRRDL